MGRLDDFITIEKAARITGMCRTRLKPLCVSAGIARVWGGSERRPILKVKLSEVEELLLSRTYQPSGAQKRKPRRQSGSSSQPLHPLVRC